MTKHASPDCVVKVGRGRGFIIEQRIHVPALRTSKTSYSSHVVNKKLIVTASHCLPHLPLALGAVSNTYERTYKNLVGRLDGKKNHIWVECLFVDPVADIAVLGCPDGQELYKKDRAYNTLIHDATALPVGEARDGKGWLLALDVPHWIPTKLHLITDGYGTSLRIGPTKFGMSGSPILNDRSQAVGVVAMGTTINGVDNKESGPQPILTRNLPGWLLLGVR